MASSGAGEGENDQANGLSGVARYFGEPQDAGEFFKFFLEKSLNANFH